MNLKHYSLIFALIGILSLYYLSTLTEPIEINLKELPEYEGKLITTKGKVIEYDTTKYGSQIITIEHDNATATVFVEGVINVEYGDLIQVTGEVQKYDDVCEIIINEPTKINILKKWNASCFPIWQLAKNPLKYVGLNINISGIVDSVFDSYLILMDVENNQKLIVFYSDKSEFYPGDNVIAFGSFSYDEKNLRYCLEIINENHGVFKISGS